MDSKTSVLIVDDETGPRESLRMILKPGYKIHAVENGHKAIKFVTENKVDLVTLDLKMPGMSGIDTLREIKKLQPEIEAVVITGYGTLDNAQEALRYGAVDFISKPFNSAEVLATVGKALERSNQKIIIKHLMENFQSLRSSLREDGSIFPKPGIEKGEVQA